MTQAPTLSTRTSTTLTVTWRNWTAGQDRGSGPVSGYYVYYRQPNESDWRSIGPEISTVYTVHDLMPNQVIELKVAAVHAVVNVIGPPSPASRQFSTCGSTYYLGFLPFFHCISNDLFRFVL